MKALKIIGALLIVTCFNLACEKVIDIELEDSKTRIVVEGGVFQYTNTLLNTGYQAINLRSSHPYFGSLDSDYSISGAEVTVRENQTGDLYVFTESETQSGLYETNDLLAKLNHSYTLIVTAMVGDELQHFEATDSISHAAPPMDEIGFHKDSMKDGLNSNNIDHGYLTLISFSEPQATKDYYKFTTYLNDSIIRNDIDGGTQWILLKRDEHLDADVDSVIINDYLIPLEEAGQPIRVEMTLISKETYFYLFTLFENSANAGSDFPAAEVKGNIINLTDPNLYGLGYFHCGSRSDITSTVPE